MTFSNSAALAVCHSMQCRCSKPTLNQSASDCLHHCHSSVLKITFQAGSLMRHEAVQVQSGQAKEWPLRSLAVTIGVCRRDELQETCWMGRKVPVRCRRTVTWAHKDWLHPCLKESVSRRRAASPEGAALLAAMASDRRSTKNLMPALQAMLHDKLWSWCMHVQRHTPQAS